MPQRVAGARSKRDGRFSEGGGSALDAVEAAIVVLEDDPTFDAGIGSHLNRDGRVELDAIVMDGATLKAGAVAASSAFAIRFASRGAFWNQAST